ncbi:MAG: PhzF family phenazine biosynthesis protein, partial [Polyangiaceae bacterium]
MSGPLYLVDAFAERAFAGNVAAVCLLRRPRDAAWLLSVARELNQSETAFVLPEANGVRELRWFTPNHEVDLCGHATLAAAHVLWETKAAPLADPLRFQTRSGELAAWRRGDDIEIALPLRPARPCATPTCIADALGFEPVSCHKALRDYVVEVESDAIVRALDPKLALLEEGVSFIVTARSSARAFDFVSRYFDAVDGEDPVTGSAHATLGPFWASRLGKRYLVGFQASSRGGVVGGGGARAQPRP